MLRYIGETAIKRNDFFWVFEEGEGKFGGRSSIFELHSRALRCSLEPPLTDLDSSWLTWFELTEVWTI